MALPKPKSRKESILRYLIDGDGGSPVPKTRYEELMLALGKKIEGGAQVPPATTSENGLMSKEDKAKLDGIEAQANKYEHPANHPASIITQDASNRFVTDEEKTTWNNKLNNDTVATTANLGLVKKMTAVEKPAGVEGAQLKATVDALIDALKAAGIME